MSNMFDLSVTAWSRRRQWDQRRKGASMPLSDRILAATCHWLKGNLEGAWMLEQLSITDACIDGDELVVTFEPTDGGVAFRAVFTLGRLELQTSALLRANPAGD